MNLLLLEAPEVDAGGRARLDDRRAEHLLRVLRVEPGRALRAGLVGGGLGRATVTAIDGGAVELAVEIDVAPPPPSGIALAVALPRPRALHRLLQAAAAMGVERLDLVRTARVEKSYFHSPSLQPAAIRRQLLLGAEQGMTPRLPQVAVAPGPLGGFLGALPPPVSGELRLVAHPGAPPLESVAGGEARRFLVAVGPEGGLLDREVDAFAAQGFVPFALGGWLLRVEAAVVAALAQLAVVRRVLSSRPIFPCPELDPPRR